MSNCRCETPKVPLLCPHSGEEFFNSRGSFYDAVKLLWDKVQLSIININKGLCAIDASLANNEIAAVEAVSAGKKAIAISVKNAEDCRKLVQSDHERLDKAIVEFQAEYEVFKAHVSELNLILESVKTQVENGDFNGKGAFEQWLEQGHEGTYEDYMRDILAQGNIYSYINDQLASTILNISQRLEWIEQNAIFRGEIVGDEEEDVYPGGENEEMIKGLVERLEEQERINEQQQQQINQNTQINIIQQDKLDEEIGEEATDEDIDSLFS